MCPICYCMRHYLFILTTVLISFFHVILKSIAVSYNVSDILQLTLQRRNFISKVYLLARLKSNDA